MTITILTITLILFFIAIIFYGYSFMVNPQKNEHNLEMEKCSLCKVRFIKDELILRQVGDSKLFYFCRNCIKSLADELKI
ncbi:MAG: hypothetical protein O3A55_01770 [Bacteroidetes bacterium]|nr:hypothetical protein [Bacteroidota bacterium]